MNFISYLHIFYLVDGIPKLNINQFIVQTTTKQFIFPGGKQFSVFLFLIHVQRKGGRRNIEIGR